MGLKKYSVFKSVCNPGNFQAKVSVQISLDFSFRYNFNLIHNFFLLLFSFKMKANFKKAGNPNFMDSWNWNSFGHLKAIVKTLFVDKEFISSFQVFLEFILTSQFLNFVNNLKRNDSTSFIRRLDGFKKVNISLLFKIPFFTF